MLRTSSRVHQNETEYIVLEGQSQRTPIVFNPSTDCATSRLINSAMANSKGYETQERIEDELRHDARIGPVTPIENHTDCGPAAVINPLTR